MQADSIAIKSMMPGYPREPITQLENCSASAKKFSIMNSYLMRSSAGLSA
jgi:hypothetical protein